MDNKPLTAGVGEIRIGKSPRVLRALAIGSCVAITIYDPQLKVGGLGHAMLPSVREIRNRKTRTYPPGKFADTATTFLLKKLIENGAKPQRLVSKLAGGAKMFDIKTKRRVNNLDIGARNIKSARASLEAAKIPIIAEDVGQNFGRTVLFELETGKLITLRAGGKHRREL